MRSAKGDGDPHDLAGWYRLKLLRDDDGAAAIVEHLRREQHEHNIEGPFFKPDAPFRAPRGARNHASLVDDSFIRPSLVMSREREEGGARGRFDVTV